MGRLKGTLYKKTFFAIQIIVPEVNKKSLKEHLKELMHTLTINH